jgi:hypothetical protein
MENLGYSDTADHLEVGDAIIVDDDFITITEIGGTEDLDEVLVKGLSEVSGDKVEYPLYFADEFYFWGA